MRANLPVAQRGVGDGHIRRWLSLLHTGGFGDHLRLLKEAEAPPDEPSPPCPCQRRGDRGVRPFGNVTIGPW